MAFKFTEEQLNTLDKSFVVELFLQLQEQNDKLSDEIQDLNKKLELLIEQVTLSITTAALSTTLQLSCLPSLSSY